MEAVLAALGLALCMLLLLRMAIGERRRRRLDVGAVRGWHALRRAARSTWRGRAGHRKAADRASGRARRSGHLKVVPKPMRDKLH